MFTWGGFPLKEALGGSVLQQVPPFRKCALTFHGMQHCLVSRPPHPRYTERTWQGNLQQVKIYTVMVFMPSVVMQNQIPSCMLDCTDCSWVCPHSWLKHRITLSVRNSAHPSVPQTSRPCEMISNPKESVYPRTLRCSCINWDTPTHVSMSAPLSLPSRKRSHTNTHTLAMLIYYR